MDEANWTEQWQDDLANLIDSIVNPQPTPEEDWRQAASEDDE